MKQRVVRRAQVLLAMRSQKTVVDELCQKVQMTRVGIWYLCRRYEKVGLDAIYDAARSGRPREISVLERVAIEQLACSEPSGIGLEMTHWSTRSLAKVAMQQGLVSHIAHSTVSLILRNAGLQPLRRRRFEFFQRAPASAPCGARRGQLYSLPLQRAGRHPLQNQRMRR